MSDLAFKIRGMDCAEEVVVLKRALGPLAGGEEHLVFDLLNGKLTVSSPPETLAEDAVVRAVAGTGMEAVRWEAHAASGSHSVGRRTGGRGRMCAASGIFLAAGFALHALQHGVMDALTRGPGEGHRFPSDVLVLYIAAAVAGGWFVVPKALAAARRLRPDMNLLMMVAVLGAAAIGEWFEAATVTFLFSLALLLESWSVGRARRAIRALMDLSPATARIVPPEGGESEEQFVEAVVTGTIVAVRPGEKIPLDGVVVKGSTSINQAPITGESRPVPKEVGDEVFAGTINNESAFRFRVTRPAADTTLARIIRMVEEAQARRAPSERWVETFARYYTPAMMGLALLIAVVPPLVLGEGWAKWFYEALVILVIACPCALVISTPVSIVAALASAARAGILIKGGMYLEGAARLNAVAMDKTGTLTSGHPTVQRIVPLNDHSEEELLERAAAIEAHSEHPVGRAVVHCAQERGVAFTPAEGYRALKGKGGEARYGDRPFWVGSHRFVHELAMDDAEAHGIAESLEDAGHSSVFVGNDRHVCGLISVADEIRPDAPAAVHALKEAGIRSVVMLTGDNQGTAQAIAKAAGVDDFRAELLPEDKVVEVERLVREHGRLAMVGDGINDAPAMAAATLGIAMGAAGADAAIETADIALMADDLARIPWLIRHARRALRTIKQSIAFALGIKLVFIALALCGLATLWMAIAADMGASLLVIFNALRLLQPARG